jgi:hypothetical protein
MQQKFKSRGQIYTKYWKKYVYDKLRATGGLYSGAKKILQTKKN